MRCYALCLNKDLKTSEKSQYNIERNVKDFRKI